MLKLAFCASEFAPLAKTGGLADVAAGLTRFLAHVEADLRIFLPCYDTLDTKGATPVVVESCRDVPLHMGDRTVRFTLREMPVPGADHAIHLVDCPELFHRGRFYTSDPDEAIRFAVFGRAVLEACQRLAFAPDVIHCNDWHTGLVPLYLRTTYAWDRLFEHTKTLLTIHNVAYQGRFPASVVPGLALDGHEHALHQDHLRDGWVSFLETGLIHADMLSTVSRTYARELRTRAFGEGLHETFEARADHLVGIVNGVDYAAWSPETDATLPARYSAEDLTGKRRCRDALLEGLGLEPAGDGPVLGIVSRLTGQKGFDLCFEVLPELLAAADVRVAVLGSGEERYEAFFAWLQRTHPGRVCFWRGYNDPLAHLVEAGSDAFLMPSVFEPCGLNQMYSMRYGTPPVVRRTGGLADTVADWDPAGDGGRGTGTGFVFETPDAGGLRWALGRLLEAWRDPGQWAGLVRRGMRTDYSWARQGREYLVLYGAMTGAG